MRKDKFILRWAKRYRAVQELGGKCVKCGETNIFKLDFHHKDPNEKEFGISQLSQHATWDTLKKEIDKCILLCSNCHVEYHMEEIEKMYNENFEDIKEKSKEIHLIFKSKLDDEHIYDMLKKGLSLNFISQSLKKDVSTIRDVAIRLEVIHNEKLFKRIEEYNDTKLKITNDDLLKLYNEGKSVKDIALMYNMSKSTLFPRIKKLTKNLDIKK